MNGVRTSNPGYFALALRKWATQDIPLEARGNVLSLTKAAYSHVLEESPVKEGKFRKNVKIGLNGQNVSSTDKPGAQPPVRGSKPRNDEWAASGYGDVRNGFKLGDVINISCDAPHATRVEYVGWGSTSPYSPFDKATQWVASDPERAVLEGRRRRAAS